MKSSISYLYIDSADEINEMGIMIKVGKATLTRKKIITSVSEKIICIAEELKLVKYLGRQYMPFTNQLKSFQ
ncbi:ribose-5-phosphate isomerase A [Candidatus Profftella armatura]